MQVPIAQIMGIATGAKGLLQKVISKGDGDFEGLLASAMTGKSPEGFLKNLLDGLDGLDENALLMGGQAGGLLVQFMSALKEMGLGGSDIKALLAGDSAGLSVEGIESILTKLGMDQAGIDKIMASPDLLKEAESCINKAVCSMIKNQAETGNIDIKQLQAAIDSLPEEKAGMDKILSLIHSKQGKTLFMDTEIPEPQVLAEQITRMVAEQTGGTQLAGTAKLPVQTATETIDTLNESFGITDDEISTLMFSSDKSARQQAAESVQQKISAALNRKDAPGEKDLEALAFLKQSMSPDEFSKIETSLKLHHPDLALPEIKTTPGRQMIEAFAARLTDQPATTMDKQAGEIMDQLRRAVPQDVKNGQGSLSLKLNPPILGKVEVSLNMLDGHINASFKADQAFTRDILQQNIQVLKDSLAEQGIKVNSFSFSSGLGDRPQQDQQAFVLAEQGRQGNGSGRNNQRQSKDSAYNVGGNARNIAGGAMNPNAAGIAGGLDLFA